MSKVTTKQCREFIGQAMQEHPKGVLGFFCGHHYLAEIEKLEKQGIPLSPKLLDIKQCYDDILPIASNMKNWKRIAKYKPGYDRDRGSGSYPPNVTWIREFDCDGLDGQLAFQILELEDGKLLFADYVGD